MDNAQKFPIPLDTTIESNAQRALVPSSDPKLLLNYQKPNYGYLGNSIKYEDYGVATGRWMHQVNVFSNYPIDTDYPPFKAMVSDAFAVMDDRNGHKLLAVKSADSSFVMYIEFDGRYSATAGQWQINQRTGNGLHLVGLTAQGKTWVLQVNALTLAITSQTLPPDYGASITRLGMAEYQVRVFPTNNVWFHYVLPKMIDMQSWGWSNNWGFNKLYYDKIANTFRVELLPNLGEMGNTIADGATPDTDVKGIYALQPNGIDWIGTFERQSRQSMDLGITWAKMFTGVERWQSPQLSGFSGFMEGRLLPTPWPVGLDSRQFVRYFALLYGITHRFGMKVEITARFSNVVPHPHTPRVGFPSYPNTQLFQSPHWAEGWMPQPDWIWDASTQWYYYPDYTPTVLPQGWIANSNYDPKRPTIWCEQINRWPYTAMSNQDELVDPLYNPPYLEMFLKQDGTTGYRGGRTLGPAVPARPTGPTNYAVQPDSSTGMNTRFYYYPNLPDSFDYTIIAKVSGVNGNVNAYPDTTEFVLGTGHYDYATMAQQTYLDRWEMGALYQDLDTTGGEYSHFKSQWKVSNQFKMWTDSAHTLDPQFCGVAYNIKDSRKVCTPQLVTSQSVPIPLAGGMVDIRVCPGTKSSETNWFVYGGAPDGTPSITYTGYDVDFSNAHITRAVYNPTNPPQATPATITDTKQVNNNIADTIDGKIAMFSIDRQVAVSFFKVNVPNILDKNTMTLTKITPATYIAEVGGTLPFREDRYVYSPDYLAFNPLASVWLQGSVQEGTKIHDVFLMCAGGVSNDYESVDVPVGQPNGWALQFSMDKQYHYYATEVSVEGVKSGPGMFKPIPLITTKWTLPAGVEPFDLSHFFTEYDPRMSAIPIELGDASSPLGMGSIDLVIKGVLSTTALPTKNHLFLQNNQPPTFSVEDFTIDTITNNRDDPGSGGAILLNSSDVTLSFLDRLPYKIKFSMFNVDSYSTPSMLDPLVMRYVEVDRDGAIDTLQMTAQSPAVPLEFIHKSVSDNIVNCSLCDFLVFSEEKVTMGNSDLFEGKSNILGIVMSVPSGPEWAWQQALGDLYRVEWYYQGMRYWLTVLLQGEQGIRYRSKDLETGEVRTRLISSVKEDYAIEGNIQLMERGFKMQWVISRDRVLVRDSEDYLVLYGRTERYMVEGGDWTEIDRVALWDPVLLGELSNYVIGVTSSLSGLPYMYVITNTSPSKVKIMYTALSNDNLSSFVWYTVEVTLPAPINVVSTRLSSTLVNGNIYIGFKSGNISSYTVVITVGGGYRVIRGYGSVGLDGTVTGGCYPRLVVNANGWNGSTPSGGSATNSSVVFGGDTTSDAFMGMVMAIKADGSFVTVPFEQWPCQFTMLSGSFQSGGTKVSFSFPTTTTTLVLVSGGYIHAYSRSATWVIDENNYTYQRQQTFYAQVEADIASLGVAAVGALVGVDTSTMASNSVYSNPVDVWSERMTLTDKSNVFSGPGFFQVQGQYVQSFCSDLQYEGAYLLMSLKITLDTKLINLGPIGSNPGPQISIPLPIPTGILPPEVVPVKPVTPFSSRDSGRQLRTGLSRIKGKHMTFSWPTDSSLCNGSCSMVNTNMDYGDSAFPVTPNGVTGKGGGNAIIRCPTIGYRAKLVGIDPNMHVVDGCGAIQGPMGDLPLGTDPNKGSEQEGKIDGNVIQKTLVLIRQLFSGGQLMSENDIVERLGDSGLGPDGAQRGKVEVVGADARRPLVFTQPGPFDYLVLPSWELWQTAFGNALYSMSIKGTKILDGSYSNIVQDAGALCVASSYTSLIVKKIDDKLCYSEIQPNCIKICKSGLNIIKDRDVQRGFDGTYWRVSSIGAGPANIDSETRNEMYLVKSNGTSFKTYNQSAPCVFFGVGQSMPLLHKDMDAPFTGVYGECWNNKYNAPVSLQGYKNALPIVHKNLQLLPHVSLVASVFESLVIDGISSLVTSTRSVSTLAPGVGSPYKDFIINSASYRQSKDYISSLQIMSGNAVPTRIVATQGLVYVGSSPEEAWFFAPITREFFVFSGGATVNKLFIASMATDVRDTQWDFVTQELIAKIRFNGEYELLRIVSGVKGFSGMIPPNASTIATNPDDIRIYSIDAGLVIRGRERCQVHRFLLQEYMIPDILANRSKGAWIAPPVSDIDDFHKERDYGWSYGQLPTRPVIAGWFHEPFKIMTADLGTSNDSDCRFQWKLTFGIHDLLRKLWENRKVTVCVAAETMTEGGIVKSEVTHIYLSQELFSRWGKDGYYTFVFQSNNGIGTAERLYIWSDGLFWLKEYEQQSVVVTQERTHKLVTQGDVASLEEF
ncbi:MAG: hypothetical protein Pg6A_20140 [Termitinemataceae bacterium]|nr:MAG: hypothetical protein Pg6A_20140 [Termitinemataceae bacterium]